MMEKWVGRPPSIRPGLDEIHHLAVSLPSLSALSLESYHHGITIAEKVGEWLIPSTTGHVTSTHPSVTYCVPIKRPIYSEAVLVRIVYPRQASRQQPASPEPYRSQC